MYYYIISALKRRLISELKSSFSAHPIYKDVVPFIQNRFSFDERPQLGIVVQGSSANKVQFSPDNYVGTVVSHVMLAYVNRPQFPLEWVREDLNAVRDNNDVMPTPPGVYFLEVLSAPTNPEEPGYFVIDPLFTVNDEAVLLFQSGVEREAQLQQVPVEKTLRMYLNRRITLTEGVDYNVNYSTGAIELLAHFSPNDRLTADYRYAGTSVGPVPFYWNQSNFRTLPGVVMAFGKRAEAGQKVALVVYQDRVQTAQAFGGKFEASFDLSVIARDTTTMEEVSDLAIMYLWGQRKSALEFEGIEIVDISMGGEAEDPADETGDDYFYTASLSIQLRADWEIHVPIPLTISRIQATGQQVANDLFFNTHSILVGRNSDFERIT